MLSKELTLVSICCKKRTEVVYYLYFTNIFMRNISINGMIIVLFGFTSCSELCSDDPSDDLHRLLLQGHNRPVRRLVNYSGSCVCLIDKLSLFSIRCSYTSLRCQETSQQNHHYGNRNRCVPQQDNVGAW